MANQFELQAEQLRRRRALADALRASGNEPLDYTQMAGRFVVPVSGYQHADKLVRQLLGAVESHDTDTADKKLQGEQQAAQAKWMQELAEMQKPDELQPESVTAQPMATGNTGEDMARATRMITAEKNASAATKEIAAGKKGQMMAHYMRGGDVGGMPEAIGAASLQRELVPPAKQPYTLNENDTRFDENDVKVAQGAPKAPHESPEDRQLINVADPSSGRGYKTIKRSDWNGEPLYEKPNAATTVLNMPGTQDDMKSQAQMIAEGRAPMASTGGFGAAAMAGRKVNAMARQLNPTLDGTLYNKRKRAKESFAASIDGRSLDSLNTVGQHLQVAQEAAEALQNGDVQRLNAVANRVGLELGDSPQSTFNLVGQFVANEIARATIGGQNAQHDREKFAENFSSKFSQGQFDEAFVAAKRLISGRISSMRRRYLANTKVYDTTKKAYVEAPEEFDELLSEDVLAMERDFLHPKDKEAAPDPSNPAAGFTPEEEADYQEWLKTQPPNG